MKDITLLELDFLKVKLEKEIKQVENKVMKYAFSYDSPENSVELEAYERQLSTLLDRHAAVLDGIEDREQYVLNKITGGLV